DDEENHDDRDPRRETADRAAFPLRHRRVVAAVVVVIVVVAGARSGVPARVPVPAAGPGVAAAGVWRGVVAVVVGVALPGGVPELAGVVIGAVLVGERLVRATQARHERGAGGLVEAAPAVAAVVPRGTVVTGGVTPGLVLRRVRRAPRP